MGGWDAERMDILLPEIYIYIIYIYSHKLMRNM